MKSLFLPPRLVLHVPTSFGLLIISALTFVGTMLPAVNAEPPTTVESQTAATAGKPVLVVSESDKTQTFEAEGRDVNIDGNNNKVTLNGNCHALTISGSGNVVHAEALTTISTPGNKNKVTYNTVNSGEKPQITDMGTGNSVERSEK